MAEKTDIGGVRIWRMFMIVHWRYEYYVPSLISSELHISLNLPVLVGLYHGS